SSCLQTFRVFQRAAMRQDVRQTECSASTYAEMVGRARRERLVMAVFCLRAGVSGEQDGPRATGNLRMIRVRSNIKEGDADAGRRRGRQGRRSNTRSSPRVS